MRGGQIKAYAVTAKARSEAAPEDPDGRRGGLHEDVSVMARLFFFVGAQGTPAEVIDRLNAAGGGGRCRPRHPQAPGGSRPGPPTPPTRNGAAAFAAFQRLEYARWKR